VCVRWQNLSSFFVVRLFLLKRKRRFLCAMCLYVHGHYYFIVMTVKKYGDVKMKKRGHFRSCVCVHLSDQRIVFSVGMSCSNPLSFLQCARTGFLLLLSKKERKREKTSIMQLCAFCIALVLVFLYVNDDVLCHVIREKKKKKKKKRCSC